MNPGILTSGYAPPPMPYGLLGTPTPVPMAGIRDFDPRSLAGCVAWWDASDSTTITLNGGNVSEWRDKSANRFHLTQSTAANQPQYSATINGRNTITYFANSTHRLINTSLTVPTPTVFAVWRVRSNYSIAGNRAPVVFDTHSTGGGRCVLFFLENSSSIVAFSRGEAGAGFASATGVFGATLVSAAESRAGVGSLWVNGLNRTTAIQTGQNGFLGISVGNLRGNPSPLVTGYNFDGQICELIVYSSALPVTQRRAVERWLGSRWGANVV